MITNKTSPYYAVIFISKLKENALGYDKMEERMTELSKKQEGFLGMESCRNEIGITICYWKDLESIKKWKDNLEHQKARKLGRETWYEKYSVKICKVEKEY